ncbi:MAG: DMT family transporter [Burkholderiaceae bacterium]|nr:DMT family transporter [Burkholderiaceae bacterium]
MPATLPLLSLVLNALVWGLSWWPFRQLQAAGLHPLWATALIFGLALVGLLGVRPGALAGLRQHPGLWLLALSSGLANVGFNWAVTVGDVVRVVLLFYLMPAWSVLLAWKLLGERPTPMALVRLGLAFAGVALVLVPAGAAPHKLVAQLSGADLLALVGGFCFALTNIFLRRLRQAPESARMLAMFGGGAVLATLGAGLGGLQGQVPALPAPAPGWMLLTLGLTLAFLLGNYALQYGAARLAAGTTSLVMLSEVVFASASSVLLGEASLAPRTALGGGLILLAALLAVREHDRSPPA